MPTFDFRGKVVLVTGVARAGQIGHAVALAFGRAGAQLVLCDRNAVEVAERAREFQARGHRGPADGRRPHRAGHRPARGRDGAASTSAGSTQWSTWRAG